MKKIPYSTMVIKYPDGGQQHVKPGPSFNGNWDELAKAIAGYWFRDQSGNVKSVPYELR
jgi:hypothetical protein